MSRGSPPLSSEGALGGAPPKESQVGGDSSTPVPETQHFGPFLNLRSKDISATNFDCPSCGNRVRKFLTFVPQYADFFGVYACECSSVAAWELENAPSCSEHWERLSHLQRLNNTDIALLTPKAGANLHGQGRN
jgi:hypothetical protein